MAPTARNAYPHLHESGMAHVNNSRIKTEAEHNFVAKRKKR